MYFISSDFHFSHKKILETERRRFDSIEEHDEMILTMLERKLITGRPKRSDTFYFLGDFGFPEKEEHVRRLEAIFAFTECRTVAILGNHDKGRFRSAVEALFKEVYEYPIYISHRLVLSHYPVPVFYNDERSPILNVHGHTHGSYISGENYMCASLAVAGYHCISDKAVCNRLAKLPEYNAKFLYEPYAKNYIFTAPRKDDIIYDEGGKIDLDRSRIAVEETRKIIREQI